MSRDKKSVLSSSGVPAEDDRDERSEARSSGAGTPPAPDVEVAAKPTRRSFSPSYKARIVAEAERCRNAGEIGRLLRREGLYSSHLAAWRKAQEKGMLEGLTPRKRGRKADPDSALRKENLRLERENARLKEDLRKANLILDVQGKVSRLLEIDLDAEKNS